MNIKRSIDIEDEIREALLPYLAAYCRPLPKEYTLPNILVSQVGGADADQIDTFELVLDSRAKTRQRHSARSETRSRLSVQ